MEYETVQIEKTSNVCSLCEDYAKRQASKPVVIMSCEGGCLRGEVARRAANLLTFELAPEKTARLCLGGAFTKDTGQRPWRETQAGLWQLKAVLVLVIEQTKNTARRLYRTLRIPDYVALRVHRCMTNSLVVPNR